MELYDAARAFMRRCGNNVQWTGGYPSREMVAAGIAAGEQYVCVMRNNPEELIGPTTTPHGVGLRVSAKPGFAGERIVATFWFAVGPEPTYSEISDGPGWLDGAPYGVVHRLASDGSAKGVGEECLEWCLERCGNIRVDTHADNTVMQNLLGRLGYTRCGVIRIGDGTPRDAFQKVLY
jgi:hypothetical protein